MAMANSKTTATTKTKQEDEDKNCKINKTRQAKTNKDETVRQTNTQIKTRF
jgi:hypothetical protein